MKETKTELIIEIIKMLQNNIAEYERFIFDLVEEALRTRTKKQLKELL